MQSSDITGQGLGLTRNAQTGALTASFHADPQTEVPDRQRLMDGLASQGWTGSVLDETAVTAFFAACQRAQDALTMPEVAVCFTQDENAGQADAAVEVAMRNLDDVPPVEMATPVPAPAPVETVIGHALDGGFKLTISPDKMTVRMNLWPAQGGRAVTAEDVRETARQIGVGIALNDDALQDALMWGRGEDIVIAEGQPARPGTPAVFESLLDGLRAKSPELDDKARVDFRTLGTLLIVNAGQALMRRIPARQGWPGTNVLGKPIPVPRLPDPGFARGLSGVKFDEGDPDVLCAAIAGSPVVVHHGVNVSPVIEIDAVDLSTGNIEFDGALRVRGDIRRNMTVHVSGDVIVHGTVEAANIQAGGNVTVEGGIIGQGDGQSLLGRVICQGTLQARFVNNARISAGGDVVVEREIVNSEVLAGGKVAVGLPGATHGGIAGGRCCAMTLVRAPRLGTAGGIVTHVQVGLDPHAESQRDRLNAEREKLQAERVKVEQLVTFLKANPARAVDGLGERSQTTYLRILEELAALDVEASQLARNLVRTEGVAIEVGQRLYSGVTLQIAHCRLEMYDNYGRSRAVWHDDKVIINTLP